MFRPVIFLLIFSVWKTLLEQCCEKKHSNGIQYQLREKNDEAMSMHECLDDCIYETGDGKLYCFKPGPFSTQCVAPTPGSVERGQTNITLRDGDQGFFCDINFEYSLNKTFQVESDPFTSCSSSADFNDSLTFMEEKKFQMRSSKDVDLDCRLVPIFTNTASGSIKFTDKAVRKTINCNVSPEVCLTNNGSVYPAKCAPTFRYKDREYHACTDQGLSEEDDRLWCATHVDSNLNLLDGKWGFCSPKCSYCGGSPIDNKEERGVKRPCGYDCLANPGKQMKGSVGSQNVPLLSPTVSRYGEEKDNFIKEVKGQLQFYTGDQLIRLSCPDSKFFDPDLEGFQTIFAQCGPKQYRFTVYGDNGDLLHTEYKNDRFGCDPCPNTYHYVPGYVDTEEDGHIGTSYFIPDVDLCEDRCYETESCSSFTYSKYGQKCNLFSSVIVEPTYSNYEDFAVCSKEAGCCERIEISSSGGTSEFQANRLGSYVLDGRHNNRAVYKQVDGTKILFYAGYQEFGWVVSSGFDSLGGLSSQSDRGSLCPDEDLSWEYYSGSSWIKDTDVSISCAEQTEVSRNRINYGKLLEDQWGKYREQRTVYQWMAYHLLTESNSTDKFLLSRLRLDNYEYIGLELEDEGQVMEIENDNQDQNHIIFEYCATFRTDDPVYEIPGVGRLREVIHEIGHLMRLYGEFNPRNLQYFEPDDRKLIKVDNFLYEIGVVKGKGANKRGLSNLYVAPIACYYSSEEGKLSQTQCQIIKDKYHDSIKDLKYPTFEKEFQGNLGLVFGALNKLFLAEDKITKITNFHNNYYKYTTDITNGQAYTMMQAMLAETFALAIFAETVRNIEMLPVTLALIQLYEEDPSNDIFKGKKITSIHPMTAGNTFYTNHLEYELGRGGRMQSVGFFPIHATIEEYLYNANKQFNRNWNNYGLLKGTQMVHERALAIFKLYDEEIGKDAGIWEMFEYFFQPDNDGGMNGKVPEETEIMTVFQDKDAGIMHGMHKKN